ncbi:actin-like ATPase domain-containing protein [Epithele typhae]|uniref:actin-like ATPase domain-containing protein n=1 Tax=Epithele typhae TaxID=378194 RepID=UPI0020078891|nr:actin-like ATPase domain-containing protein [Epithele typhae]KAH9940935.1 actin-like ATPase domain-containing protein [Epithele typhae]
MSNSSFRDSQVVIIETGRTCIRAGQGLHDLLRLPAVQVSARVGLRRSLVTLQSESGAQSHRLPVGSQLDDALATGQDILVSWPFDGDDIKDYTQAEALWKHILFTELKLRRLQMESPVMLSIAAGLSRDSYERICQIFFERFNAAGFAILERPIAQFYAVASGTQLSAPHRRRARHRRLHRPPHPHRRPDRARRLPRLPRPPLPPNTSVMAALAPAGAPAPDALQADLLALARHVWQSGLIKALAEGEAARELEDEGVTDIAAIVVAGKERAVIESGLKRRANAKAQPAEQARAKELEALDLVTTEFRGVEITLGKERHRFCEPLFDPSLLRGVPGVEPKDEDLVQPLQSVVGDAVGRADVDQRTYIWQGLFVTGEITNRIKGSGLSAALSGRLSPYLLSGDVPNNEVQPRHIKTLKVPDYFAEYRDKGDGLAAFLGTSIVAKLAFTDSAGKNYVSKADYASGGPRTILGMSPSLF